MLIIVNGEGISEYVIEMIFFALLPFVLGFFCLMIWRIVAFARPRTYKKSYLTNALVTTFVIIFLAYPAITSSSFGMFNCRMIEGVSYL